MDPVYVTQIVDAQAKTGYSEKTKKDWSMSRVGLSNGDSAFIFNPIALGDVVELKEINGYQNWVKVKTDPKHDEIIKLLKLIASQNKAILDALGHKLATSTTPPPKAPAEPRIESTEGYINDEGNIEFPEGYFG